jgi:hypothetical protein
MQQYWDHLPCIGQHPRFSEESEHTQAQMRSFSQAFRGMTYAQSIKTLPLVDSPAGVQKVVEEAAFSRLHPIYNGIDYWAVYHVEDRSSADTGSGGSAPGSLPAMFETTREGPYTMTSLGPMISRSRAGNQTGLQGAPSRDSPPGELRSC